jgi:hypothetical protein
MTLPAAVCAPPAEDEAVPTAVSRPAGVGMDGLPLRPAEDAVLLLELEDELELELELELLGIDGEGMDTDGDDEDEEELEGIDGIELCDDCC